MIDKSCFTAFTPRVDNSGRIDTEKVIITTPRVFVDHAA